MVITNHLIADGQRIKNKLITKVQIRWNKLIDELNKMDQVDIKGGESYPDILDKVKEVLGRWIKYKTS